MERSSDELGLQIGMLRCCNEYHDEVEKISLPIYDYVTLSDV